VAHPSTPAKDLKELIAYAKANPDKINGGNPGNGTLGHITSELLQQNTGTKMTHVPYRGTPPLTTELFKQKTGTGFVMIPYKSSGESVQSLLTGDTMITIADPPPVTGPLKAGTVRGLAITSAQRHPSFPDLPTMAEAGVPDMEVPVWTAFFVPAKTPAAIISRLQKEVARVVQTPEVKERFAQMGLDPVGGTPEELARITARDLEKYTAVAKAANIKND